MKLISESRPGVYMIGRVGLRQKKQFTQHYECAAWHKTVECEPQVAELRFIRNGDGGHPTFYATFTGKVTSSNFVSLFGGVPIGKGGINEEVGKDASYTVSWEAEFNLGALLARTDFTYQFDIDLDAIDIRWEPWKSKGEEPGDILYREDKPWDNLPSTGLKATVTPHDPKLIEALRYQAEYTLKEYPSEDGLFKTYWTSRLAHMTALLERAGAVAVLA